MADNTKQPSKEPVETEQQKKNRESEAKRKAAIAEAEKTNAKK